MEIILCLYKEVTTLNDLTVEDVINHYKIKFGEVSEGVSSLYQDIRNINYDINSFWKSKSSQAVKVKNEELCNLLEDTSNVLKEMLAILTEESLITDEQI